MIRKFFPSIRKLFTIKTRLTILYLVLDVACVGLGMGVPFFSILLGLPTGWFLPRYFDHDQDLPTTLRSLIKYSALTSAFTLLMMLAIWGPLVQMVSWEASRLAKMGIPMILFEPRPSFIAWIILMVVIAPFLQFLMTLFGGALKLTRR